MARRTQPSRRSGRKATLPVVGAAGVSLALVGGASATAPANAPSQDTAPRTQLFLAEEEISDASRATCYVFDKDYARPGQRLRLAQGPTGCAQGGCAMGGCAPGSGAPKGCKKSSRKGCAPGGG